MPLQLSLAAGGAKKWVLRFMSRGRPRQLGLGVDPITARNNGEDVPTSGGFADEIPGRLAEGFRDEKRTAAYAGALRTKPVDKIETAGVLAALQPIWQEKLKTALTLRGQIEPVLQAAKANGGRTGENPSPWREHVEDLLPKPSRLSDRHHAAHRQNIAATTGPAAAHLSRGGIAVTGAPVSASGTVAMVNALSRSKASTLVSQGYALAVLDTAADIRAMTVAQIHALSARNVPQINASDRTVSLRVAQVSALEAAGAKVSAPASDAVLIVDTAAQLETLTASQIDGLLAIGVTGLVSMDANVRYSSTQTAAILARGLSVAALGSHTVTENFADGDYSVYQGGRLIRQTSVSPDGSYDAAFFDVTGQPYSSYEAIYNSAEAYVVTAKDNLDGSGDLTVYANGFTITTSPGSESVTVGSDTFGLTPHSVETTTIENNKAKETFVYDPGFGQDTISGFLAAASGHDHLQFSASMFGFSATASQTADAQALLNNFATGTTNTTITDLQGDTLTLSGITIATLKAHLADFKFA